MVGDPNRVGIVVREQDLGGRSGRLPELAQRAVEAGIDHLTVGDHVSFAGGHGADGLIQAAAMLSTHPGLPVQPGSTSWPCVTRPSWHDSSRRSRCSRRGDSRSAWASVATIRGNSSCGWLALWISPRRFEEAAGRIDAAAEEAGREGVAWQHALQLWAGFDKSRANARQRLSAAMRAAYALPFERFERYAPCGPPEAIAEALTPYLALGCRRFNFVPEAASLPAAIEAAAEVKALLAESPLTESASRP